MATSSPSTPPTLSEGPETTSTDTSNNAIARHATRRYLDILTGALMTD